MSLENKVVLLTGASSGIGYAIGKLFAEKGATVYAMARRLEKLEELKAEVEGLTGKVVPVQGDVSSDEDIKNAVDLVMKESGRIDVLINNAGILDDYKSLGNMTDELWDKVFSINVTGVMKASRAVIPHMLEQKKGVILNTASVGGLHGMRGGLAYVASKHAVIGMTKNIGYTYHDDGIRCVAVAPGGVATDIGNKVGDPDMKTLDKLMGLAHLFPKVGQPIELANVYAFLASDEASFINGTTVVVDGGWTAL